MAWSFGDGFDLYTASTDMANGYWDSISGSFALTTGRFSGSRALSPPNTSAVLLKTSGVNDAVHHLAFSLQQTVPITGSRASYFQLRDGATAQVSIIFFENGQINLVSGGTGGSVLASYTNAYTVEDAWYHFEIEVVINNTTGSFKVRKNGNSTEDFTATGLDTQVSANAYANVLAIGGISLGAQNYNFDDLFWRSDASSVAWMGEIRCITRMPASDASVAFSRAPTTLFTQNNANVAVGTARSAGVIYVVPIAPTSGTITSLGCILNAAITGHIKMALYDNTGPTGAGTLIASGAELTNPGAGLATFAVSGSPTVTRGTLYWVAVWGDVAFTLVGAASQAIGASFAGNLQNLTYAASFPSPLVSSSSSGVNGGGSLGMNVTPLNASLVAEAQQDAATSYVYSSTIGQADLYGIDAITSTPATVIATTVRAYAMKTDVGGRTAAVQLKSGATTVASSTLALTTSGWQWAWRTDLVDPNTGVAWTPAAVAAAQIGPKVIA